MSENKSPTWNGQTKLSHHWNQVHCRNDTMATRSEYITLFFRLQWISSNCNTSRRLFTKIFILVISTQASIEFPVDPAEFESKSCIYFIQSQNNGIIILSRRLISAISLLTTLLFLAWLRFNIDPQHVFAIWMLWVITII